MSKKILMIIAFGLYIGNSNCAMPINSKQRAEYNHKHRLSAFEITENPYLVVKIVNILIDELRVSQIGKQEKETKLEEYRKMIIKKAEALDKEKADLKKILIYLSKDLYPHFLLDHNWSIVYAPAPGRTGSLDNRDYALNMQFTNSIGSQTYKDGIPQVKLTDLIWSTH